MNFIKIGLFSMFLSLAFGKTIFYSPAGTGNLSGNSKENTKVANDVNSTLNTGIDAGDTVYLTAGIYHQFVLKITSSGDSLHPKVLMGEGPGKTIFVSDWDPKNPGTSDSKNQEAIRLASGASFWKIANLEFRKYATTLKLASDGYNRFVAIENIKIDTTRDGFWFELTQNVTVRNSEVQHYTKKGFRIQDDSHALLFEDCNADATAGDSLWANLTESIPMGFYINSNDSNIFDIVYRRCVARNNVQNGQTGYANGDGFCSEKFSHRISYVSCEAYDNQDGGFDLKGDSISIDSSISFRNYRNYRLWSGNVLITNSIAGYGRGAGIWAGNSSQVEVNQCTMVSNARAFEEDNGSISGERNIIWENTLGDGICSDCPDLDPMFVKADSSWEGLPINAFNSLKWGVKYGYYNGENESTTAHLKVTPNQSFSLPKGVVFDVLGRPISDDATRILIGIEKKNP